MVEEELPFGGILLMIAWILGRAIELDNETIIL